MFCLPAANFLPSTLITEVELLIKESLSVTVTPYSAAAAQTQDTRTIVSLYEEYCSK